MIRNLTRLSLALCFQGVFATCVLAQEAASHSIDRGSGFNFSIWKLVLLLILFWVWVRTTDWASRDCQWVGLNYSKWNTAIVLSFFLGFFVFGLLTPIFFVGFPLLLVCYFVPLMMYIHTRNLYVTVDEMVLSRDHLRHLMATRTKMGVDAEKQKDYEKGAPVVFKAAGGKDEQENQANMILVRQLPAYVPAKELFADAVGKRATKILLDYTKQDVRTRFQIDGVWHNMPATERELGDGILVVLKKLAGLNPEERRAKQRSEIKVEYQGKKYILKIASEGVRSGERVVLDILEAKPKVLASLEELGMREKMVEQFRAVIGADSGMVVIASLPGGGLSTTASVSLRATDRLLRDFMGIGDVKQQEPEVENVDITCFDPSKDEKPEVILTTVVRKEPDAVVVLDVPNTEVFEILCQQVTEKNRLVVTTIRGKDAADSLFRIQQHKVPADTFAPAITGVLYARLVRKLCEKCKEPYTPSAEMLQRLGIPAGRVEELYRERQPPGPDATEKEKREKEEPCKKCAGIGYFGQTAIFELLALDDQIRQTLIKQPQAEAIRKAARKAGNRGLKEEGILLVVKGVTSLDELSRVLKQSE